MMSQRKNYDGQLHMNAGVRSMMMSKRKYKKYQVEVEKLENEFEEANKNQKSKDMNKSLKENPALKKYRVVIQKQNHEAQNFLKQFWSESPNTLKMFSELNEFAEELMKKQNNSMNSKKVQVKNKK
jgi:hypothetical protein